ncbi:MAG: TatD family hydrolase [Anaerolineaceae bacterium]|nr:TatD family hydrolase [Anaerolineaceae bacterium]
MLALTDTHCHLNLTTFHKDLAEVIERAWTAGLDKILVPAIDLNGSYQVVELCDQYPNLYAAVGVHPNDALTWQKDTIRQLRELAQHPKVVAIGEIGLDYYRDRAPQFMQKNILTEQLELAAECQLPVILHNREAFKDLWEIIAKWQKNLKESNSALANRPGVLHSFSEDVDTMQMIHSHHFFIGISGPVTYKNAADLQAVAEMCPDDHLLIETDAPFLTPHPFRGQRNEPAYVQYVARKVAQLRQSKLETIIKNTTHNADQLFAWRSSI